MEVESGPLEAYWPTVLYKQCFFSQVHVSDSECGPGPDLKLEPLGTS